MRNSRLKLTAYLLSGAAICAGVGQYQANSVLRKKLAQAEISTNAIKLGWLDGSTVLQGFDTRIGADHVHIGQIRLHGTGFSLIAPAQATAGHVIELEDISAESGSFSVEIPGIKITGSDLSQKDLTALFDSNSKEPLSERLKKLNAESIESEEITISEDSGDDTSSDTTYNNVKATGIVAGKIANLNIESIEQSADMKDGSTLTLNTGAFTSTGVDMPVNAHFMLEKGAVTDPLLIANEHGSMTNVVYSLEHKDGEGYEVRIDSINYGQFKLRGMTTSLFDWVKSVKPRQPDVPPDEKEILAMLPVAADIFRAMEGSFELKQISAKPLKEGHGPVTSIARIALGDYGKGGLGTFSFEGVDITLPEPQAGHVKFDSFSLKDLKISDGMDRMAEALKVGNPSFDPRSAMPSVAQLRLVNGDFVLPDTNNANSEDGKTVRFNIGKFEANLANYINAVPSNLNIVLDHFGMDAPKKITPEEVQPLRDWNIARLDSSAKVDLAFAEGDSALNVNEISLNDPSLGKLALKGNIGNVSKDIFALDSSTAALAAVSAKVKLLDLKLENSGFIEKLVAMRAKDEGKSPEELKKSYSATATMMLPVLLGGANPGVKALQEALSKFMADPKNLHIEASAKDGLGASDIAGISTPADIMGKIELKAAANE